ncbi:MAG: hypothetical protein PWP23_1218 [Candidatus Sumerlaeota bacterium]|nr:hypothetical protein [Candidatus Sumerlaeota bacterium]
MEGKGGFLRRHADTWIALGLLACFALSRFIAVRQGLVFNFDILDFGYQFLDPALLKHDLSRSLWFLHSQPPGFNLFLGVILKLAPGTGRTLFAWAFRLMGVLLVPSLFFLQRRLGVPRAVAAGATLLVVLSPAALLYENWLFYTYPVALLLVVAALCFARFAEQGKALDGFALFAALAALVYLRSIFHPVWFLALVALAAWSRGRGEWRRTALLALGPFVLVLALFGKNLVLFGEFTSSTWLGMSASKMTTTGLTDEEWARLRAEPGYPAILDIETFESVARYEPFLPPHQARGIPALDTIDKTTGYTIEERFIPFFNLNHAQVIDAAHLYGDAAKWVFAREPMGYWRSVNLALIVFFKPASEYLFLAQTPGDIRGYEKAYNLIVHGKIGRHTYINDEGRVEYGDRRNDWANIGFLLPPLVLLPILYGFWLFCGIVRRRRAATPADHAILFLAANITWRGSRCLGSFWKWARTIASAT